MNLLDKDFLLVDKPAGLSSFAVVARVRRILTEQMREDYTKRGLQAPKRAKVGHAGTLDPFATGLLICLLGKGTRRAAEFLKKDKRYEATICLGKVSTTGDPEGEISEYRITDFPTLEQVQAVVSRFQGKIRQRVPAYSAVKINGRRAYDLARKGIEVEMPEREVEIYKIAVVDYEWPYLKIDCKVSSGTYIRALGEDIGKALGVGGYLTELRRTEIGDFSVKDAVTLEDLGITS
ncbi:tRNA pseudouridine(55) synthase TruB [Candidatus Saccharibacteria bacterium]|nr:tRNA pseudouridine(55) synthase TruB [Candidatus Saccharibacteria bacterium]